MCPKTSFVLNLVLNLFLHVQRWFAMETKPSLRGCSQERVADNTVHDRTSLPLCLQRQEERVSLRDSADGPVGILFKCEAACC